VQGQICDILRPQLAMNRFLPLWPHRFPHFVTIHLGGVDVGGALIFDRRRAFDLLQVSMPTSVQKGSEWITTCLCSTHIYQFSVKD
jgi:hypothetical protein